MVLRLGSGGVGASSLLIVGVEGVKVGDEMPESLCVANEVEAESWRVSTLDITASMTWR